MVAWVRRRILPRRRGARYAFIGVIGGALSWFVLHWKDLSPLLQQGLAPIRVVDYANAETTTALKRGEKLIVLNGADTLEIVLENVETLDGACEARESDCGIRHNLALPGGRGFVHRILSSVDPTLSPQSLDVVTSGQEAWESYLQALDKHVRHQVTRTPFAQLTIRSKTDTRPQQPRYYLVGDSVSGGRTHPFQVQVIDIHNNQKDIESHLEESVRIRFTRPSMVVWNCSPPWPDRVLYHLAGFYNKAVCGGAAPVSSAHGE